MRKLWHTHSLREIQMLDLRDITQPEHRTAAARNLSQETINYPRGQYSRQPASAVSTSLTQYDVPIGITSSLKLYLG